MYGYAKAYDDATIRGVDNPQDYLWWLDVETENSWQADKAANVADLEGMTAYFKSIGAASASIPPATSGARSPEPSRPAAPSPDCRAGSPVRDP